MRKRARYIRKYKEIKDTIECNRPVGSRGHIGPGCKRQVGTIPQSKKVKSKNNGGKTASVFQATADEDSDAGKKGN